MKFLLVGIVLSCVIYCETLDCEPCSAQKCTPVNIKQCPYGIVKDACNCCDACAKGPGEICGGDFDLNGKCGKGLKCQSNSNNPNQPGKCTSTSISN